VENLVVCPIEEDGSSSALISWKHSSVETIVTKKGEERKKLKLIYKSTKNNELIEYLKPKLQYFVSHNFIARWQDQQFRNYLENFPNNIIILVINFAKTYNFEIMNEVQSMHWHNYQITILVHVT
jgi:HD-GYP domain-containing protein (c-di-GMP phosphodiesterase class II)